MPRDIEEFLKMAAKRRQQQKQKQQQQPRGSISRHAAPPVQPATDEEVEIVRVVPARNMRNESVREHVQTHIDTSDIAEQVSHLGERVGLADDKLEARLQKKFDHDVGRLQIDSSRSAQSETTAVTAQDLSAEATTLMQMLRNPVSIRQAILLSEILQRPELD